MSSLRLARTLVALGVVLGARLPLQAQELRGAVRDAASRQPIPGAVITLIDARGTALGRNITDQQGHYRIIVPSEAVTLRFVRIGFRPFTAKVPRSGAVIDTLDIAMTSLPTMLDPVTVRANACPTRSDAGPALGLLEQARAGLLNSVVARKSNPASVVLIRFQRMMEETSDRIASQTVTLDSTPRSTTSFYAARSASEFVQAGFVSDASTGATFYGPDAEALLDDAFIAGYCFHLVKADKSRASEVGLGFATPSRARNRVDIDGVLWVDTVARRLQSLEFRYVGLDRRLDDARPGGWVSFREMPNGIVIIDRWSLRLPVIRKDSVISRATREYVPRDIVDAQETGGEVAQINWPSLRWNAPLGTLQVRATNRANAPAVGARVQLENTTYAGRADSNGSITITRLLPGPYKLVTIDSQLETIGVRLSTSINFTAVRDSVHRADLVVQTANDYVAERCIHDGKWSRPMSQPRRGTVWIIGRVVDGDNVPIRGVTASAFKGGRAEIATAGMDPVGISSTSTGTDGIFTMCSGFFSVGDSALVHIDRKGRPPIEHTYRLTDTLTVLPLIRDPRRP
jgi:carboxypeptidase family protein